MTIDRHNNSDDSLAALFATAATDAPTPDQTLLDALRERSTAAFVANDEQEGPSPHQRYSMFATRALLAMAATAALLVASSWLGSPAKRPSILDPAPRIAKPVAQLTLGDVISNVARLKSYQGRLEQNGRTYDVWGGGPERLRLEETPDRYTIVAGDIQWHVDELENRAQRAKSRYFSQQLDANSVLRLVNFTDEQCLAKRPAEKRTGPSGGEMLVFYCSTPHDSGRLELEAVVDAQTKLPTSISTEDIRSGKRVAATRFTFVAAQVPLDEAKFEVASTLTEDGRIGKVTDWQGLVSLRPMTVTRWTPICDKPILRPGDWLRTDARGANAVTVQLAPKTTLILGPGSLVEMHKPDQLTIHSGTAEVTTGDDTTLKLTGPGRRTMDVNGRLLVRADADGLHRLTKDPPWLAGYKGNAIRESLGSLVANIDGRETPLTVGYHKVSVEIRDQIARTTIEESFVNHTDQRLEGQFHFPLPADASISGFGMWIGNELVEADIVEKQRAREIYETILREKRDPGLLEWTGGNIFKARVFPIFANSEKRIKITYTQVLPRSGPSYRYSYALHSDLLRQNPLRQLDLAVTVASTIPLKNVQSPTHLTRNQLTPHAASVEFSAQQYTPERDFEVVVEVDGSGAGSADDLTFIPHRRGDDGYFMLLLQPPMQNGAWQRDVVPDSKPLDLLILADTSASIDPAARGTQSALVAAILSSLSPQDKFNLAVCDVDCTWAFPQSHAAEEKNIATARDFVAKRRSLGWTDLDKAFASVAKRIKPGTQVVYLGDGIVTHAEASLDGDGPAFARRLARMVGGKGGTLHAVALTSSFDAAVMRGIASIGGGSIRQVSGEVGPQVVARDLLAEMTRPSLRNIRLEFAGLRTARVYPGVLPNVPAGEQQIVLGRFLPLKNEQPATRGEVVATGTLDGKLVTYRAPIDLTRLRKLSAASQKLVAAETAGDDASFIPRLWARMHLDELLAQGTSQEIQDEIINLSEEFHIMTPYTSLLVLESDADRERFKVKPRFQMRDGERFFAEGRDEAQYQLVQQQMRRAGLWRLGMRSNVMQQLAGLGRDVELLQTIRGDHSGVEGDFTSLIDLITSNSSPRSWYDVGGPGLISSFKENLSLVVRQTQALDKELSYFGVPGEQLSAMDMFFDGSRAEAAAENFSERDYKVISDLDLLARVDVDNDANVELATARIDYDLGLATAGAGEGKDSLFGYELPQLLAYDPQPSLGKAFRGSEAGAKFKLAGKPYGLYDHRAALFEESGALSFRLKPLLPIALPPLTKAAKRVDRTSLWAADAREVSRSVLGKIDLTKLMAGLAIEEQTDELEPHRQKLVRRNQKLRLISRDTWLTRDDPEMGQTSLHWRREGEHGIFSPAFELAIVALAKADEGLLESETPDGWRVEPEWQYQDYSVEVQRPAPDRVLLVMRHVLRPHEEVRKLIDTRKSAILTSETFHHGRSRSRLVASELVEVAGVWLPQRIEHFDRNGQLTRLTTRKYRTLSAEQLKSRIDQELALKNRALVLKAPFPKLSEAKERIARGNGRLEEHLTVLIDLAAHQRWPEAHAQWSRTGELMEGKSFAVWAQMWLLEASRRLEELKTLVLQKSHELAATAHVNEWPLAERLRTLAGNLETNEWLAIHEALKPVYARLPEHRNGLLLWGSEKHSLLATAGRDDEDLKLLRELAAAWPGDADIHRELARRLAEDGDDLAAFALLKQTVEREQAQGTPNERDELYKTWADLLAEQGRYGEVAALLAVQMMLDPEDTEVYERYLAALIYTRREAEADKLTEAWLRTGLTDEPLSDADVARLRAAIETAEGDNSSLSTGHADPRWFDLLAELLVAFSDPDDRYNLFWEVTNEWQFRNSDQFKAAARKVLARLKAEAASLPPDSLDRLVRWVTSYSEGTNDDWKMIAAAIRARWNAAAHPTVRDSLASSLLQVLTKIGDEERLAFLRLQLEKSDAAHQAQHASALFEALLNSPWSAEVEAEALALIEQISSAVDPGQRIRDQVVALYRWTDRMEQGRLEKLQQTIEPDKLTRTELRDKNIAITRQARIALAERLKAAAEKRGDGLKPWLTAERLYLEVKLERELPSVVKTLWQLLDSPAAVVRREAPDSAADDEAMPTASQQLAASLQARLVTMLLHLATRKEALAADVERLGQYLDKLIAADPDRKQSGIDAKLAKYILLIALDKPNELAGALAAWNKSDDRPQTWTLALAYLKAELGQLDQAAALAETLALDSALSAADYRMLAAWHQALGNREKYEKFQLAAFELLSEYELRRLVQAHLAPWQRTEGPSPGQVDPQVFLILKALLAKSQRPADHVYLLKQFYEASRDYRLVTAIADSVIGQSAQKIYPFLASAKDLFDEIDREATVDEIVKHVATLRERAKTPVDRRALDLVEMLAEKRASELINQPGPHAERALAALKRAAAKPANGADWSAGEARAFADMLARLGKIAQEPLAAERRRVLESLLASVAGQPLDRLEVAQSLAETLSHDGKTDEAIDVLGASLAEHLAASGGERTWAAIESLRLRSNLLTQQSQYIRSEQMLLTERRRADNPKVAREITWLIYGVLIEALANDASTSLGSRHLLYRLVHSQLIEDIEKTTDQRTRQRLIDRLCELYRTAHGRQFPQAAADVVAFGKKQLPPILDSQINEYQNVIYNVSQTIHAVAGPPAGLEFLVDRILDEPSWLTRKGDSGWRRFAWHLAEWRHQAQERAQQKDGAAADVETRLLRLVLTELRRDLTARQNHHRVLYHENYQYFWKEKKAEFARVAEEVLRENRDSVTNILYVADYLFKGLELYDRAIAILFDAHERKLLDDNAQAELVGYLHARSRFGESIPVLQGLVERHPYNLGYRVQLMHAFHQTNQSEALLALLESTDKYFHEEGRWSEEVASQLGASTLANGLYEQAVEYYKEAIARREEALAGRGIGDQTLAGYYLDQAEAYSALKNTAAAVDAASSALVVWGAAGDGVRRRNEGRVKPLEVLRNVLQNSPNLDAFVAELDKQTAGAQQDRPAVRKALGEVYLEQKAYEKAITQLKLALELAPNDSGMHAKLVECYDALGRNQEAADELFAAAEKSRRDIDLWVQLAQRLEALEQPLEAERARTSIVEVIPNETEGHAKLAEIRQEQGRWDDAIQHWQAVARRRKLEPAGLLNVAAAQLQQKDRPAADKTLQALESTHWPARFQDELRTKLPQLREKWRQLPIED